MSTEHHKTIPIPSPAKRLTRSRVLLGLVGLCLVLWTIKAIHRSTQPQYQGKTIQEWFALWRNDRESMEKHPEFFSTLDQPAMDFLWQEYTRKDSAATTWLVGQYQRFFRARYYGTDDRRWTAYRALSRASPEALSPLRPAMISELKTIDPRYSGTLANLLAMHRARPEETVPVLLESLQMTNRDLLHRFTHYEALGRFGPDAAAAIPLLQSWYTKTNVHRHERGRLAVAIVQINGPGPELDHFTNGLKLGDFTASLGTVFVFKVIGTNARPVLPMLIHLAHSFTNQVESNTVMEVVRTIDPQGIYQRP